MSLPETSSIQLAKSEDLNAMLTIMDRANQYALEKGGEPQWTMKHSRDRLRMDLNQDNCYVMRDRHGRINATMALTEEDLYCWEEEGKDQKALYFHKLMKDPGNAPANAGRIFISFAAHEALRRGKIWLRCDAKLSVKKIVAYYENLGFIKKRFIRYPVTGNKAVLLEASPKEILRRVSDL